MERYETYKDSGVEWIGEIPEGWGMASLKWKARIYAGGTPDKNRPDYWFNGNIPWLNSGAVNQSIITDPSDFITEEGFNNSSAKWIEKGSVVIALAGQGKTKGMSALVTFRTTCNQSLSVISPVSTVNSKYLLYYLQSNYLNIRALAGEGNRDGLNLEMIGGISIPLLSVPEQTVIAKYLDRKTAEIDSLIAQKQHLIELYQEEKTAIINQAVTRGIDPNAKLKASGIEWLGEIPTGWIPCKLKHLVEVKDGTHDTPEYVIESEDTYPLVTSKDLVTGHVDFSNCKHIAKDAHEAINKRSDVVQHDIIMPMIGTVGGAVIVETSKPFSIKNVALFKTSNASITPQYIKAILDSNFVSDQFKLESRGGVQDFVSLSLLKNIVVFTFGTIEQSAIVQYIETETARIDAKIAKTKRIIELQKEYRNALISEVVTGKIKVSHLADKEMAL